MDDTPARGGAGAPEETRIVFMGTPSFAAWILEGLLDARWNVAGAVTQPDRPRGRGRRVSASPVKELARARGIPVLQPESVKDPAFPEELRRLGTELVVTAAFGRILSRDVLALPPLGCFNIHFSLLPAYRGPAPVARAILNGEPETGITIFLMDEGTDTGPVLASARLAVDRDDTTGSLTGRLAGLAREILPGALERVVRGTASYTPQDPVLATHAPMLRKSEGRIRWTMGAEEIHARIRTMDPWPGAFTFWRGKRLVLRQAETEPGTAANASPGQVTAVLPRGIVVCTGQGSLVVHSLQLEGGKRVDTADFIRGHRMEAGERFLESPPGALPPGW